MSQRSKYNSAYVYVLCCIAALAGLMFGYSTAVITGVVLPLQQYYQLTPTETGWAVSSIVIGCIIGALVGGKIADKLGRKPALLIIAIIFIASSLGAAMSESFMIFSLSRIVCGFAVGMAGTASTMYMSELAPAEIRGKALGIYNISVVSGQVIVFIVNYLIAKECLLMCWFPRAGRLCFCPSGTLHCDVSDYAFPTRITGMVRP